MGGHTAQLCGRSAPHPRLCPPFRLALFMTLTDSSFAVSGAFANPGLLVVPVFRIVTRLAVFGNRSSLMSMSHFMSALCKAALPRERRASLILCILTTGSMYGSTSTVGEYIPAVTLVP
ncbi:hypothetical protein T440DRAFT_202220 [Plenodomus tracheiphilus IPT5]|uniref:Uncharacterized protein n=1 Tax=Plenodomus tracheiphilus IPT5 TaxID=1408161 RepID=A0A6A7BHN5_9PLEO|nr:hypothetical protein T440DRAFT_202220 [Plenodomus tracheiphilus IPT5]